MTRDAIVATLTERLVETGHAHHQAFLATNGADPDWSIWYAGHLLDGGLAELLGQSLSRAELARTLCELEEAHRAMDPDAEWSVFYARELVDRLVARPEETLALYHFASCPYCRRVRQVIERLGIDVELRDIHRDDAAFDALVEARGRPTVPVLRCTSADHDRWLPESRDIIAYLESRFS